ncbi:MAG: DNA gyrase subunit A, partial [Gemmatimonadota bacterium]|nr:DNA gyrase subunit A [Gemmatimonadota bacterium]
LADIDKETVDFAPNFDDRLEEPKVLPARIPNLLVNGSSGIAVGMSTNIPPHNLGEVIRAAVHLLDHPECTVEELMVFIPGPDFPTGGIIVGTKGIEDAYATGRGRVVMRARVVREQKRNGREQLVVTEIPYGTNKARIIEQIAELTKVGKLGDISDLRDESDRDGIRMVVELRRGGNTEKTLAGLYKWTNLQATFGVIILALEGGVPREFGLKSLLERFRDHRLQVVVRRSRWELDRARDEAHVLDGLRTALRKIDTVVQLIRSSRNRETAAVKLRKELKLSDRQAEAILAMRLSRLTALEGKELRDRLRILNASIEELGAILESPARQLSVVRQELEDLRRYADPRRTRIVTSEKAVPLENLQAAEEVVVIGSREGYLKQVPMALYRRRASSGKRLAGMDRYENDYLQHVFVGSTADTLLFFTEEGRVHALTIAELPEAGRASRGRSWQQLLAMGKREKVVGMLAVSAFPEERFLLFATSDGTVKRSSLDQYARIREGGTEGLVLKKGDRLLEAQLTDGSDDLVLATSGGRIIRFPAAEVAPQGRIAQGVRGVKLREGERLIGLAIFRREMELALVTARGLAKKVPMDELSVQGRGGLGSVAISTGRNTGAVVGVREILPDEDLMAVTALGRTLRIRGREIALGDARSAPEALSLGLSSHDVIVEVTRLAEPEEIAGPEESEDPAELAKSLDDAEKERDPEEEGGTDREFPDFEALGSGSAELDLF